MCVWQGAQAFPGTFHICGDNYPDAAGRVALNRQYSGRQVSATAQLALDVLTWDCTRLPLRNACADVIVSDLVRYVRLVSAAESAAAPPPPPLVGTTQSILCLVGGDCAARAVHRLGEESWKIPFWLVL